MEPYASAMLQFREHSISRMALQGGKRVSGNTNKAARARTPLMICQIRKPTCAENTAPRQTRSICPENKSFTHISDHLTRPPPHCTLIFSTQRGDAPSNCPNPYVWVCARILPHLQTKPALLLAIVANHYEILNCSG